MMFCRSLLIGMMLALPGVAMGQTGYTITGGMSNFDCGNHCDDPCDEFEVEIEDLDPHQVVHTYHNSNYGAPSVTLAPNGTSTLVDYHNPQHLTAVGAIEHFGITLSQLGPTNLVHVRWMRNGRTATVNGQTPLPGGGSAPSTQPVMPTITAEMGVGSLGQDGVTLTVINNDLTQSIWVKRRGQVSQGVVTLESLMTNDPVVTTTVQIDASPFLLGPGQSVSLTSDLIEVEDNQSVVFAAQYFQDITGSGPFSGQTHSRGLELGNVMTASIASPDAGCGVQMPFIVQQPADVTADAGRDVNLRINADGNDLPLTYQWMKEGLPLTASSKYSGVTSDELSIMSLDAGSEGFYSCRVSNTCGSVTTNSVLVFITGHNQIPPRPTTGACCDSVGNCTLVEQAACAAGNSWDSNVTCANNSCVPPVTGACCDLAGNCTVVEQAACASGLWDSALTCDINPCTPPTIGACCNGAGCVVIEDFNCTGSFLGGGSVCGATTCCIADFNQSGVVSVQDIFDFLGAYFSQDPMADVNLSGTISVQDIFDFLTAYFGGC